MISPSFPGLHCGIGDYTSHLVSFLSCDNLEITVITSEREEIKQYIQAKPFNNVIVLPIIKHWGLRGLPNLWSKISELQPDILHIQYQGWLYFGKAMITLFPFLLKRFFKKNYFIVTTFHDLGGPYLFRGARFFRKIFVKILARYSDKIVTTTKNDTDDLLRLIPSALNKLCQIPAGAGIFLDSSTALEINRVWREVKDDVNQILISNFGFLLPFKGVEDLLDAVKILIDKKYIVKLLVIGGFEVRNEGITSYFQRLQKKVDNLGIKAYVKWLGHRSLKEVFSYLSASDLCVLPYSDGVSDRRTSFTSVLSCGLPIVTTRFNNTSSKLVDGVNCMLVPSKDSIRLATAIEELIKSPGLRRNIGLAAKRLYDEEYSWHNITNKTLKVYNEK